jgi:hypothetical protein
MKRINLTKRIMNIIGINSMYSPYWISRKIAQFVQNNYRRRKHKNKSNEGGFLIHPNSSWIIPEIQKLAKRRLINRKKFNKNCTKNGAKKGAR